MDDSDKASRRNDWSRMVFGLACVVWVLAAWGPAWADDAPQKLLHLTDGSFVAGQVVDESETAYLVRLANGDAVRVPYDDIINVQVLSGYGAERDSDSDSDQPPSVAGAPARPPPPPPPPQQTHARTPPPTAPPHHRPTKITIATRPPSGT